MVPQDAAASIQISYLYVDYWLFSIGADIGIEHVNKSSTILPNHEFKMYKFEPLPMSSTVDDYVEHYRKD